MLQKKLIYNMNNRSQIFVLISVLAVWLFICCLVPYFHIGLSLLFYGLVYFLFSKIFHKKFKIISSTFVFFILYELIFKLLIDCVMGYGDYETIAFISSFSAISLIILSISLIISCIFREKKHIKQKIFLLLFLICGCLSTLIIHFLLCIVIWGYPTL
jgi:hypothetical protein